MNEHWTITKTGEKNKSKCELDEGIKLWLRWTECWIGSIE